MTAWLNCKILQITLLLKHLFEILIQDYHDFLNQEIKSFLHTYIYRYIYVRKKIIILVKLRLQVRT